jgi:hypothetical protein
MLLIDTATGTLRMQGFNGASSGQGNLTTGSGVSLGYGGKSVRVKIDEVTGRVSLP